MVAKVFVGCSRWLLGGAKVLWLDARVFVVGCKGICVFVCARACVLPAHE